jgi:hypothetical protein
MVKDKAVTENTIVFNNQLTIFRNIMNHGKFRLLIVGIAVFSKY